MKSRSGMRISLYGLLLVIGLALGPALASALGTADVVAEKALVPPVMDGNANDPAWVTAQVLTLTTVENENHTVPPASVTVTMKFAYDSKYVYVLAQWPDASWSVYKHAWAFDAATHKWAVPSADEDRFAIMWDHPLFPVNDFLPLSGCKGVCHSSNKAPAGSEVATANESFLSTNAANEKMDLWHWKAARTSAAGTADDQGLKYDFSGKLEAARPADAKTTGGPADNKQTVNNVTIPKYYKPLALTENEAAFILKSDVDSGKALPIHWVDDAGTLYYTAGGVNTTVPATKVIPGYILSRWDGSRGDIDAA
ncbi:MAG: ethylbenzene dehydrogenase-related protein, partial [Candidatus Thermoplasmatota archaeon]